MSSSHSSVISSSRILSHQVASLLLYQSVFQDDIGIAFIKLLQTLYHGDGDSHIRQTASVSCLYNYGNWFQKLVDRGKIWQDHIIDRILTDDNPFSRTIQKHSLEELSPPIISAVKQDLKTLQTIAHCHPQQISQWVQTASQSSSPLITWDISSPKETFFHTCDNWSDLIEPLAAHYQKNGIGIFSEYHAFTWQNKQLKGIAYPDPIRLFQLIGYEEQKSLIIKNTETLLKGYKAQNILLYGSRGSGKSSLIKSLIWDYGSQGLRIIEVTKQNLKDLGEIMTLLRDLSQKFIIFVDDLSFEEDDENFKSLKVILEGNLIAKSQNMVVYATSNRRHLIREFWADRPKPSDEEIHSWDSIQEKLSFSDRFGITLTFDPADQETYLNIIRTLAQQENINLDPKELEFRAKQWAIRHNGRSGRTARQFLDVLDSELKS